MARPHDNGAAAERARGRAGFAMLRQVQTVGGRTPGCGACDEDQEEEAAFQRAREERSRNVGTWPIEVPETWLNVVPALMAQISSLGSDIGSDV